MEIYDKIYVYKREECSYCWTFVFDRLQYLCDDGRVTGVVEFVSKFPDGNYDKLKEGYIVMQANEYTGEYAILSLLPLDSGLVGDILSVVYIK